jgi:extracellular factor (EF) 3-hydroxypalmitic acid methyl ester biosynthesis protein
MAVINTKSQDNLAVFHTSQGQDVRATLLSFTAHAANFEIYSIEPIVRASEILDEFKIFINDRPVYSGRAVVRDLVNTGTVTVCSVMLDDFSFDSQYFGELGATTNLHARFEDFVAQWEKVCKVLPEFKVAIADIQTFLIDLRRWMEQIELGIRSSPRLDRGEQERSVIQELGPQVLSALDTLFERFEIISAGLPEELRPVHRSYIQRHLHPIVLCAPFAWRSYHKPLGYAGDYEMVNMMVRDPQEGSSLFAKIFNVWLLHQGSAAAHRNRIEFLKRRLVEETATAARHGRKARIMNLGCGPAWEIQEFLEESALSDHAQFTLFDFNEETLTHASQVLQKKRSQFHRATLMEFTRKSVQQLLKDTIRINGATKGDPYDFIYCAGLFDYLPDRTCKRLMSYFYQSLAPGGLVLATNVAPFSPNRGSLELILDWHLIYRDASHFALLRPDDAPEDGVVVQSDSTGVNVFLESRKPNAR